MQKFVRKLRLANKHMDVYRLVNGVYELYNTDIDVRFEGLEPVDTALRISDNVREKVMLITSNLICDIHDILITDLLYIKEDDTKFVCSAIRKYDERNLEFLEVLMRQVDSPYHEDVEIYRLSDVQENYDPIFKQWEDSKNRTIENIRCLVTTEPLRHRGDFSNTEQGGQMIETSLLLIVDLPTIITTKDKVKVRGEMFHIRRVEKLAYQTECALEKILPSGNEFVQ